MKIKGKKKQTDSQGLVPKLRFPEFRDTGAWEEKHLRDLAKRITRKNKAGEVTRVLTNSAENGVLDQRDYFDKDIANQSNLGGYFIVDEGDYVYNPRVSHIAPVGPISKNKLGKGVMSPLYTVFRFKNRSNDFFEQYFKTTHWHHYLRMVSNSGARHDRMSITNGDFEIMLLLFPVLAEQQKIADCLSSLDELIAAQANKLDTLKAHKKGLMQQLFPAPGQTIPTLRFPEFKADWVSKKGDEITTKITKGSSPNWQGFSYQSAGILFITSENVRDGFLDVSNPKYLPEKFYEKQKNSQLSYGDILINIVGASIGRNCMYLLECKAFTNQAVALFRADNKNSFRFVNYCCQHDRIQNAIIGSQSESARPNLSLTDLRNIEFLLPSLPEQQKIADCLSSLDELITAQADKLDALKAHKKGLMQQLFPNPDKAAE